MTPQQLKNSILKRAMEGRLVPQRAEEGTAKELLRKIQAEKAQLLAAKKIKKTKPLPPITEEEKPFAIPASWEWVRLGEIGDWSSGATPKRHHTEYYGGNIPWLKTGDLNDGYIKTIPESITQEGFDNSSVRLNPVGSVLMAMYGATIGKLGILSIPATTNQACCACIPYSGTSAQYLFYYLMSQRGNFIRLGEGGAQPNISKEKIVKFIFPLPPLAEQRRIVAKIEELLPLIDKYDKAYTKLTAFNTRFPADMKKSLLQYAMQGKLVEQRRADGTAADLLKQIKAEKQRLLAAKKIKKTKPLPPITEEEKPFAIPDSWEWVRLGDVSLSVADGDHQAPPKASEGIPFLVISNVSSGKINFTNTRFVSKDYFAKLSSERVAERNDILFTVTGSYGISILVDTDRPFCFQRHIALIKSTKITEYLLLILNSPLIKQYCDSVATGTAQKTVGLTALKNMLIPLPPLAEQHRIVAKLEELLPLCEQLQK